jgi:hypothetical protein
VSIAETGLAWHKDYAMAATIYNKFRAAWLEAYHRSMDLRFFPDLLSALALL